MESLALRYFLNNISGFKDELYCVVLFGSLARNECRPDSDIDLLLVTKKYNSEIHNRLLEMAEKAMELADYEELLAPHVISLEHFEAIKEAKSDFYKIITVEGKELWKAA